MIKQIFALLMFTAAAQAQTVSTTATSTGCFANGRWFPMRDGMCFAEDAGKTSVTNLSSGVTVSNASRPQCEDGWSLVDAGRPMCARELREPK